MTLSQASCLTLALAHEKRGFRFARPTGPALPVLFEKTEIAFLKHKTEDFSSVFYVFYSHYYKKLTISANKLFGIRYGTIL